MSEYNLATIRALLGEAFSSGEITTLAFDLFHNVYQDFTAGMTRSQKIKMVIDEAQSKGRMIELLAYVQEQNCISTADLKTSLSKSTPQCTKIKKTSLSLRRLYREKAHLDN